MPGAGALDVLCRLGVQGPVAICCGTGNNAGDGLVIARHLDLRGIPSRLLFWSDPAALQGDAGLNYQIAARSELSIHVLTESADTGDLERLMNDADWIVDALLGTGARGEPRSPLDTVLDRLNAQQARKLAIDVPSGLDCDTGIAARHTFRADHTCTFVAAKPGLVVPEASRWVGEIHIIDIGIPRALLRHFGIASEPPSRTRP